jgi:hypothetical protein
MRWVITWLVGILLATPAFAIGEKKMPRDTRGVQLFYEEFIIDDPSTGVPLFTSFCRRNDNHLLYTDAAGVLIRCYVPAGFEWVINTFSGTATGTITADCAIQLAKNGVAITGTVIRTGNLSIAGTVCDYEIDIGGEDDGRLEVDGDSCTKVVKGGARYQPGDYLSIRYSLSNGGVGAGCGAAPNMHIAIGGWVAVP